MPPYPSEKHNNEQLLLRNRRQDGPSMRVINRPEEVQMKNRLGVSSSALASVMAGVLLAPAFLGAQAPPATTSTTATKTKAWTAPRTPDGQPDLQGYWTSLSFTPMERPAKYGEKEFLTDEEAAQVFKAGVQHAYEFTYANSAETPVYDSTVYALGAWQNGEIGRAHV